MVSEATPITALAVVPKQKLELVRPIASVKEALDARSEMEDMIPKVLKVDIDFGKFPGTDRECLFKAGAERVNRLFGAHPEYEIVEKEIDHDRVNVFKSPWTDTDEKPNKPDAERMKKAKQGRWKKKADGEFVWQVRGESEDKSYGLYRYVFRCRLVRQDGMILGECVGSCSTLEEKYISRPRDCENTVIKMGQKRAYVGATLNAYGLSDRFTADVDDVAGEVEKKGAGTDDVIDGEVVDPRDAAPKTSKPKAEIDQAVKEAEAKAAAAKRDVAMVFLHHFCDRIDAVSVLKDGATDDDKKGAFEAFMMVLDEEKAKMDELAAAAPKFHLALKVLETVVGAHLSGMETKLSDQDKAAYAWLQEQRANRPEIAKESAA